MLELWDVLLAEDPGLELVDMVCVAMLLRIRWQCKTQVTCYIATADIDQVIEANYSAALMLLLKYPAPSSPHGAQSFVDDAIYLRNNFSAAGGADIVRKYSGKSPSLQPQDLRPGTPLGQGVSPRIKFPGSRSPLPSPARFLQQQGGVEALLHGAAKGVFDRGERLGINQAVRDAVGEVKKNMQGLQVSRTNSISSKRNSDAMRWSLDEGRSVPSSKAALAAMIARNQQLSVMLHQAMSELRTVSSLNDSDKDTYVNAIDLAVAKVDFVKIYLEDSTMPLPAEEQISTPEILSPLVPASSPKPAPQERPESPTSTSLMPEPISKTTGAEISPISTQSIAAPQTTMSKLTSPDLSATPSTKAVTSESGPANNHLKRPVVPVPTRSTIANSSFSWMLDSDNSSTSGPGIKGSPPKSTSPFVASSSRKPTSGVSREKAAFLFGEDAGESQTTDSRSPSLAKAEEGFDLKPIRSKNNDE